MSTTCKEIEKLLVEYIDRELSIQQDISVESHLRECTTCSRSLQDFLLLNKVIQKRRIITPSKNLHDSFETMLQEEINFNSVALIVNKHSHSDSSKTDHKPRFRRVTLVSTLILTLFVIILLSISFNNTTEISKPFAGNGDTIRAQLALFDNSSASKRIEAINYFNQFDDLSDDVVNTLFDVLNFDENVNVRVAALDVVTKNYSNSQVRSLLLTSLNTQTEPLVQILLIKFFANKKELEATSSIRKILRAENTFPEVRKIARVELNEM